MNNICGSCGGFIGNFVYSGDGAKICNCRANQENRPVEEKKSVGIPWEVVRADMLKNKKFREAVYWGNPNESLGWELEIMRSMARLTQKQLAKKMKTKQESISRAEQRGCSYEFLTRAAKATGNRLEVKVIKAIP